MTALTRRAGRRARLWAGFRCSEPVVVLESDDWGLRRRDARAAVASWGQPSGWADEHSETGEDLDRLAEVLSGHVDPCGRQAAMTMNVIAANADREAIEAGSHPAAYSASPPTTITTASTNPHMPRRGSITAIMNSAAAKPIHPPRDQEATSPAATAANANSSTPNR